MSHCNITMRDRFSMIEQANERIAILELKNKRLQELLESAESNLRSIFERVKDGENVSLHYQDGSVISVVAAPDTEAAE